MKAARSKLGYRILKRFVIAAAVLAVIILSLHLWYVHNARRVLKQYIYNESGGRFVFELSQLELNLLSNRIQVNHADLISTDSAKAPITYHVTFRKISLKVGSLWSLIFRKQLLLDSVQLQDPVIRVMQWRKDTAQVVVKDELSIPQEMGKFYTELLKALDAFGVRRIIINNASVSLVNKMRPGAAPVTISKIFFDLSRSTAKSGGKRVAGASQSIELRTTQQDINLPGERHHLAFRSFRLHLFRQSIELDSCTVTAVAKDSLKSNYKIFFKKLLLTGVDFNAMSTQNVIKADSVYCEEPFFDFNLYRSDAVKRNTTIPDANAIVKELTGNLDLAFVGVKNAGLHFDIYGRSKRSFFNSNKDNFEMHNFRINPNSPSPVSIRRFNMTLRDYHLYNEDSTSAFSFDSLHFLNSRVVLNNFRVRSRPGKNKLRNQVDITVPYFQLSDLDWAELIFDQNFVAKEAVLHDPVINFVRLKPARSGKKIRLYDALQNIDSLVNLGNVTVINGTVNMQLSRATSFNMQKIDFKIFSDKLLGSVNKEGLRSAVDHLSFSNGILKLKDISAQLKNARFTGNNLLYADEVAISGQGNKIVAVVNNVDIDNMQLDDASETVEVDGLGWKSATIAVHALPPSKSKGEKSTIHIRNVSGKRTAFNFTSDAAEISTFVESLDASSLLKKGDHIEVEGFLVNGNDFSLQGNGLNVHAGVYQVNGNGSSVLKDVQLHRTGFMDTLSIRSPEINFSTDLNDVFANVLHFTNIEATSPVIISNNHDTATQTSRDTASMRSPFRIDKFSATSPSITITTHRNDSVSVLSIPASVNSKVEAEGILVNRGNLEIGALRINTNEATLLKPTGEKLGVEKGRIAMELSGILLGKKEGKMAWSGFIHSMSLQNAEGLKIGNSNNNLVFKDASLGNINLSSELMPDFGQLVKSNLTAWLNIPYGQYIDSNTTLQWYNARFQNNTGTLSLDSFIYHPTLTLDSTLVKAPYQLDYITAATGSITISGLDVAKYEKDSSFNANAIKVTNPVLTVYRDKFPPKSPFSKDKLLPVKMISAISIPVTVDSIMVTDGIIIYSEKNARSRKEGALALTDVNASIHNIKNNNLSAGDSLSLYMQSKLMGEAPMDVWVKQSYTDTLQRFSFDVKLQGADLSILNPVLVPLSNIKIVSGNLDSLSLRAFGNTHVATGEMDMHYHNLRIQLIKDGDPEKSTFGQKVLSFLANTFIIRNKNSSRKGMAYFERSPKNSFVKYLLKTTMSGMLSSVGVKKNRKYKKQYEQHLKEKGRL